MEAVVFDMDGVIFDTERMIIDIYKEKAKKYKLDDIEKVCASCIGLDKKSNLEVFKKSYPHINDIHIIIKEVEEEFEELILSKGPIKKYFIKEILEFLKENNYKIALASSTKTSMVKKELELAGLIEYFKVIVGGDMVEKGKPNPDIFFLALEKLNVKPKESYIIEDSINGTWAAIKAGAKVCMVPDFIMPSEELLKEDILIFNNLEEVMKYIQNKG